MTNAIPSEVILSIVESLGESAIRVRLNPSQRKRKRNRQTRTVSVKQTTRAMMNAPKCHFSFDEFWRKRPTDSDYARRILLLKRRCPLDERIVRIIYIFFNNCQQLITSLIFASIRRPKSLGQKASSKLNDDHHDEIFSEMKMIILRFLSSSDFYTESVVKAPKMRPVTSISLRCEMRSHWSHDLTLTNWPSKRYPFVVEIGCLKRGEIWFWEKWWKLKFYWPNPIHRIVF